MNSEILFAPSERKSRIRVHRTSLMQNMTRGFWSAEEDAALTGGVYGLDMFEDGVPIRSTKVGWCSKTRDDISILNRVVDHDIGCIVHVKRACEVLHLRPLTVSHGPQVK